MKKILLITILSLMGMTFAMEQKQIGFRVTQSQKNIALSQATVNNNENYVLRLLAIGANPNTITEQKLGPLSLVEIAVTQGNCGTLKALIEAGANLETRNLEGHTPLIRAAYANMTEVAQELLKGGADVNAKSLRSQKTALYNAHQNRNYHLIELLIAFGANLEEFNRSERQEIFSVLNTKGYTDLHPMKFLFEATQNNPTILLRKGNDLKPALHYLLELFYSDVNDMQQLKAFYENLENNTSEVLQSAKGRVFQLINVQIQKEFNIDKSDTKAQTPLYFALENADEQMVHRLLHRGVYQPMKNGITTILGHMMVPGESLANPFHYVLTQLKNNYQLRNLYPNYAAKYEAYLSIFKLLLKYNEDLAHVKLNFELGRSYETMTPKEFAEKYTLHEVINLLPEKRVPSLKKLTSKKIISNVLQADDFNESKKYLSSLSTDILALLLEEINKQTTFLSCKHDQEIYKHQEKLTSLKNVIHTLMNFNVAI